MDSTHLTAEVSDENFENWSKALTIMHEDERFYEYLIKQFLEAFPEIPPHGSSLGVVFGGGLLGIGAVRCLLSK
ncbi:expressed unknown protein [Seminavis robusta]|uniref:Uncharacterized protein n=1 Tax=Seminavis robusta TaxID=568900 RepID=A0A9N8HG30_9STRA|nr:expressed unknown protein [Seminavis robusta]|eukprot:Sro554_g165490.1 n/a (74) ;mRNA; r:19551-19860